ncbi:MAG: hypothetical protein ABWY00_00525 [Dongiaceae bacterium]
MTGVSTATAIAIAATAVAAGVSAVGAVQQGQAQSQQAKYNAAVARNNQVIANQNADDALKRGEVDETEQRKKTQLMLGQQRAGFAAQGADLGSGSVLDILGDTAATGELDALTIRGNAQREARQYLVQGNDLSAEATLKGMEARQARTAGYFDMTSSLLGGVSKGASMYGK